MAGRPKHYEEEVLIERATEVFWKKGYTASSAQDLMTIMDIGQGSFYRTFNGGKKELYQKTIKRFLEESITIFHKKLDEAENPIEFIKHFFHMVLEDSSKQKRNGCYLGNSIVELSNLDEDTKSIAAIQLNRLKEGFEKALVIAKEKGLLGEEKSTKLLALHLINLWNGINITQRTGISKEEKKSLLQLNLQVLSRNFFAKFCNNCYNIRCSPLRL